MRSVLVILVLFVVGCGERRGEYEERVIETGYRGSARVNPYLAAERFLEKGGWEARSSRVWSDYDDQVATIFMPGSFLSTRGIGMRVLEWVEEGGMLVLTLEGGEAEINDFRRNLWQGRVKKRELRGLDYLLEELEIAKEKGTFKKIEEEGEKPPGHLKKAWHLAEVGIVTEEGDYDLALEFEGDLAMSAPAGEEWDLPGTSRLVTVSRGDGLVMVLSHARPFRNPYLARADHAAFLELVADWHNEGPIIFLYGSGSSLKDLLWQNAHQAIIAGLVLLVVWLWMRVPRFGPILRDEHTYRRPYGDDLKAAAKFLWRKKALGHLILPLRAKLEREHASAGGELYRKMATEAELSPNEVVDTFTSKNFQDPGAVTKMARNLQLLRKK